MSRAAVKKKGLGGKIAAAVLVPALFFGLLEIGARLAYPAVAERYVSYQLESMYIREPEIFEERVIDGVPYFYSLFFPMRYIHPRGRDGGRKIRKVKGSKTLRIFSYGGSSTAGSPFGHWGSYSRFLEDLLRPLRRPGTRVEMMNFGVGGMGSTKAARILSRTLRYKPDLVIVYTGHNEFCDSTFFLRPEAASRGGPLSTVAWWAASHSTLVKLGSVLFGPRAERPPTRFTDDQCQSKTLLTAEQRRELRFTYERNLRHIASLCRREGVPLLLLPQFASMVRPPTCPAHSGWEDGHADEPVLELEARVCKGDGLSTKQAADLVEQILELDPRSAVAHYWLGERALEAGRRDAALRHLEIMLEEDRTPKRFRPSFRQILRELGDGETVFFLDVEARSRRYLHGDPLQDGRLLIDRMHPNITGQKIIAETIFDGFLRPRRFKRRLLDYARHDTALLWRTHVGAEWYALAVCERYVEENGGKLPPKAYASCVRELETRLARAGSEATRRARRSVWELLFYHGLRGHPDGFRRARAIYDHPNRPGG